MTYRIFIITAVFLFLSACSGPGMTSGEATETGMLYGAVTGIESTPANGVLFVHLLDNGTSMVEGQINVPEPANGSFYEGWLLTEDEKSTIRLGQLVSPTHDARYSIRVTIKSDISAFSHIRITHEEPDGNSAPGSTIATGILMPTSR